MPTDDTTRRAPRHRPARAAAGHRRLRRLFWLLLGVGVVGWLAVVALKLDHAVRSLERGVNAVDVVKGELTTQDLADGRAGDQLTVAHGDFAAAHADIHNAWTAPLRILPWVGRQVRSADALAAAADTVTGAGGVTLADAHRLLNQAHQTGPERAALLGSLHSSLVTLQGRLATVSLGPTQALLPVLADKRNTFADDLGRLEAGLTKATGATGALSQLLSGTHTYLVLGTNNAEMRDGSGMALEAGTLQVSGGQLTFGTLQPTDQLASATALAPPTGDLQARWGFMQPGADYRDLLLSPQFPQNAALAAAMWKAQTGQQVDGVIAVDVDFVKALLGVTGPVSAGGITVSAASVEQQLLVDQYAGLSDSQAANAARHEQLGLLAGEVFTAVQAPGTSLPQLATAFDEAANGRHVLLWSSDPAVQSDWHAAGVDGQLRPDDMLLGLSNAAGNKLDPDQQVNASVTTAPHGADTLVTVSVTVTNRAPASAPSYAAGGVFFPPGVYNGFLSLEFPSAAQAAGATGPTGLVAVGPDSGAQVMAVAVRIAPGGSQSAVFHFLVSGRHGTLRVAPSARLPAVAWTATGTSFTDSTAHEVGW